MLTVFVSSSWGTPQFPVTDAQGKFVSKQLAPGTYRAHAIAESGRSSEVQVDVVRGETARVELGPDFESTDE